MLESLAKIRIEKNGWKDAEEESAGTQVFKIAESLKPFYLYALNFPKNPLILRPDVLKSDTEFVFKSVKKHGFFPSPYCAIEGEDQYMDFAAFMLEFSILYYRWASIKKTVGYSWNLNSTAKEIARKAFDFLYKSDYYVEDEKYVRWGGATKPSRIGKAGIREYFTDTYFTAVIIIALEKAIESSALQLQEKEKDNVRNLIKKAGEWIADRSDRNLLTGDEKKTNRKLIYTTWGLRALVETYDLQEPKIRQLTKGFIPAYLDAVDLASAEGSISITQEYLSVLSAEYDTSLDYEDRSSWAGILLTLISLSDINDFQTLLETSGYLRIQDKVLNGLLALRDTLTDLWYKEFLILSIHAYLSEALLNLQQGKQTLRYSFEVTSALVARTMKEAVEDPRILKLMQQVFYEKLERNASQRVQNDAMEAKLNKITT
ncbi:MAG: hypothetical protein KKI12_02970 [Proteobacteria bacterium]|nr:hypothetical protein [Pseudomonadota bacterium]